MDAHSRVGTSLLFAVLLLAGCDATSSRRPLGAPTGTRGEQRTCDDVGGRNGLPADFEARGKELHGDVNGDGEPERITLRHGPRRPEACRNVLVVEMAPDEVRTAVLDPLEWPSTDPKLRLLAEIDGRDGLEVVVALSPAPAVYRPGVVLTSVRTELVPMRLGGRGAGPYPHLVPFHDEVPSGVDCTGKRGEIVVTRSSFGPDGDDSVFEVTRTSYRAGGTTFRPVDEYRAIVDCCNEEAARRWPETTDDPFRTCPQRDG